MECPKYFYFRVKPNRHGTVIEIEDASDADVVEVVRCKDCKHYQFADNRAFGIPVKMCEWFGFEDVDDDDFCSRAERRTDEQHG